MLQAILHGKLGRAGKEAIRDSDGLRGWREAITRSEDCLTSLIFGRLAYLQPDTLTKLFSAWGLQDPPNRLSSVEFWPGHEGESGSRVEPDVVFVSGDEQIAWIFEVKWLGSSLYIDQLDRERAAAMRGLDVQEIRMVGVARDDVELLVPNHAFLRWSGLPPVVRRLKAQLTDGQEPQSRLLQDILESLMAFRIGLAEFSSLAACISRQAFGADCLSNWIPPRDSQIHLESLSNAYPSRTFAPTIRLPWNPKLN